MKKPGLEKAKRRVSSAERIIRYLEQKGVNISDGEYFDRWSELLNAIASIPEILLASTKKGTSQSRQWYGDDIRPIVKTDPLLLYIRQARGIDFHSGGDSTSLSYKTVRKIPPGGLKKAGSMVTSISFEIMSKDGTKSVMSSDEVGMIEVAPFCHVLLDLKDHRGNTFAAPKSHLGVDMTNISALGAAILALKFYKTTVEQAGRFC